MNAILQIFLVSYFYVLFNEQRFLQIFGQRNPLPVILHVEK